MHLVDQPINGTFTNLELERLAAYRAAVAAGFYTDWDGSVAETDTETLAWLLRPAAMGQVDAYPFTAEEQERLERLKAAVVQEGRYADDQPPADASLAADQVGD